MRGKATFRWTQESTFSKLNATCFGKNVQVTVTPPPPSQGVCTRGWQGIKMVDVRTLVFSTHLNTVIQRKGFLFQTSSKPPGKYRVPKCRVHSTCPSVSAYPAPFFAYSLCVCHRWDALTEEAHHIGFGFGILFNGYSIVLSCLGLQKWDSDRGGAVLGCSAMRFPLPFMHQHTLGSSSFLLEPKILENMTK